MDTETLDKLYLEWSQFTRARTLREIELLDALRIILEHPNTTRIVKEIYVKHSRQPGSA
jgi:hypothetical protein